MAIALTWTAVLSAPFGAPYFLKAGKMVKSLVHSGEKSACVLMDQGQALFGDYRAFGALR